jgi:integrase
VVSVGQGTARKTVWRSLPQCKGKKEAELACGKIVQEIAGGGFALPDNATLAQWAEHWISIGCPGQRRQAIGAHANERYETCLRVHVLPVLGHRPLQKLQAAEIDALYTALADKLAPRTLRGIHVILNSCLSTAVRTHKLARSPIADLAKIPSLGESDHGVALDETQLRKLIVGFSDHPLHAIVNVAAFTGARRSEILALRWEDFDPEARTLRIERSIEHTRRAGLQIKGPKSERGKRTIEIDAGLATLLLAERDRALRLVAGVPDGVDVNLSLIKLPAGALMFPAPPRPGEQVSPTMLLDAGVPVATVAARGGHDPAVLLRTYAKRTRKGDGMAVSAIAAIARNVTGK